MSFCVDPNIPRSTLGLCLKGQVILASIPNDLRLFSSPVGKNRWVSAARPIWRASLQPPFVRVHFLGGVVEVIPVFPVFPAFPVFPVFPVGGGLFFGVW